MATKIPTPPKSLGRQLNFTTGRMNALCAQELEPYGLSLPQWVILSCLWREGDLTTSALAKTLGAQLPATSRIIDRMIERDLLARRTAKEDGRVSIIALTQKGQALDHLVNFYLKVNDALLDGFSEQEREIAFELLKRMEQNATKALK